MIQLTNAVDRYRKIILQDLKDHGVVGWLAGGALRDYFMGVKITTDYDIFFPNEEEYQKCKGFFESNAAEVKWESDNGMKVRYKGRTFDLIKKFFESPRATINAFDFTVSMFAVDYDEVYFGDTSFMDLAKRQLMVNDITYPASTMSRAFRYYKKGFIMCQGEMKKIVLAIQDMPKENNESVTQSDSADEPPSGGGGERGFFFGID